MLEQKTGIVILNMYNLLGEAPIQTQAIAQKYRKMPMGRTGIVGLRLFLR
ncbi:hypothetical protein bthur0004_65230 [Bacillus thuringiensis serovar sotto str. T04001]|nr:hypothetical protein bthur0004_65230 [Bacillus thuringiensis serovar sotto str. T04001]